jgi:orotidine 5'-phosphate decarboxylase subfamily 1
MKFFHLLIVLFSTISMISEASATKGQWIDPHSKKFKKKITQANNPSSSSPSINNQDNKEAKSEYQVFVQTTHEFPEKTTEIIPSNDNHDTEWSLVENNNFEDYIYRRYDDFTYESRAKDAKNPIAKMLLKLMASKQTNLAVAPDLDSLEKIIELMPLIGPYICLLKIHADTLSDFSLEKIQTLQLLASKHKFLIMEDRQFVDNGITITPLQYTGGPLQIASWAHLVTAHTISVGMIEAMNKALEKAKITEPRGVVILAQMGSNDTVLSPQYPANALLKIEQLILQKNITLPIGISTQKRLYFDNPTVDNSILRMTPGIGIPTNTVEDQHYITPQTAFQTCGTDIAIFKLPRDVNFTAIAPYTQEVRKACWNAYLERIKLQ